MTNINILNAQFQLTNREYEKAIESINIALDVNPTNKNALKWKAIIYRDQHKFFDALVIFQKVLDMYVFISL